MIAIRLPIIRAFVLAALLGCFGPLGCFGTEAGPPTSSDPHAEPPEAEAAAAAEERVGRIRALLWARHPADLPTRAVLERHVDAEASLRQLAAHDDARVIRARALTLLRHYPSADTRRLLLDMAGDTALPAAIRAAALRGMEGFDLARDAALRAQLREQLDGAELMLAMAAAHTLAAQPGTIELVRRAAADPASSAQTRRAAASALSAQGR